MSHTPEPWHVEINESEGAEYASMWPTIHSADSEIIGTEGLYSDIETDKANARRIVACVNACAGIDIDFLERIPLTAATAQLEKLTKERDELQQQRDTLLAALKMIANEAYLQPEWERYAKDRIASIESLTQEQAE